MASAITGRVTYNSVDIQFPQVSFGAKYDYDGTDRMPRGIRYSVTVRGVVYPGSPGGVVADFPATFSSLRSALAKPGMHFSWSGDALGIPILSVSGQGNGGQKIDRNWGPKPRDITIQSIPGGASCRVQVTFDMEIPWCDDSSDVDEYFWAFAYSVDQNFSVTRQVAVTIRCRSGVDSAGFVADNPQLLPAVPKGFFRVGIQHSLTPDGRTVRVTASDRQVYRVLPRPMTNGSVAFRIEQRGAMIVKNLSGFFEAPNNIDKKVIAQVITSLIAARFPALANFGNANSKADICTSFSITNHEFENRIDFSITTTGSAISLLKNANGTAPLAGIITLSDFLGQTNALFNDIKDFQPETGDSWVQPGDEQVSESAGRNIFGTYGRYPLPTPRFDICNTQPDRQTDTDTTASPVGSETNTPPASDGTVLAGDNTNNTPDEAMGYPYTSYVDMYQFMWDYKNIRLPLATNKTIWGDEVPDVIHQIGRPALTIIHTGTARRIGKHVTVPDLILPEYKDTSIALKHRQVRVGSPRFMGDGVSLEYACTWNNTYLCHTIGADADPGNNGFAFEVPENKQVVDKTIEDMTGYSPTKDAFTKLEAASEAVTDAGLYTIPTDIDP